MSERAAVEMFANDRVTLMPGDCLDVLKTLEANSVDSIVTDPPYGLEFMGKAWDHGVPGIEYWKQVFRVLKPGAHLVAFGGTRTYHRMVCAIEDAGFEIRDQIGWAFGSGFPKSHDVSKGIDKAAGVEREVVGVREYAGGHVQRSSADKLAPPIGTFVRTQDDRIETAPATDAAREWDGWGTALKPAWEPIVLARKPLSESTIAANVLKWGTGALNIDGCRVGDDVTVTLRNDNSGGNGAYGRDERVFARENPPGRWPANVIHDGSDEVVGAFPETSSGANGIEIRGDQNRTAYGTFNGGERARSYDANSGSAARFFYSAKADSDDRLGSKHPTVKPLDLMQYLVRLVTPPKGLVLDPFAGTGTTGEAAFREGMRAVLIEREEEYQEDILRRMRLLMAGPDERAREAIKAKMKGKPVDALPLFGVGT